MAVNLQKTTWTFFVLINLLTFGLCSQNEQTEEPHFTQSIIHPFVNEETARDPKPFKPFPVILKPDANTPKYSEACKCGVHDFTGDTQQITKKGVKQESFVIPGKLTDQNQFPFVVALVYRLPNGSATHFCGGSLISSKLILTATHCLHGKAADKTEIWLNERDLLLSTETDHPTLKIKAAKFIPHPEYNPLMNYNDISLIELTENVDIVKHYLRPICLPTNSDYDPLDYVMHGYTAGWGQIKFNGPKSDHLRHVDVPLLSNKACNEDSEPYYNGRITTHMICAGDLNAGGRDACPGDSGGPLFIKHGDRFRLIGIVSWGERCSEPRRPGVYTRVSKYLRWINKVEADLNSKLAPNKNPSVRCTDIDSKKS